MALADYQPETRVIPVGETSFQVKGLSLTELTTLVRHHLPDLDALFDLGSGVFQGKTDVDESDVMTLVSAMVEQAPGFVANLIALAAGETDEKSIQAAYKLPFPVQIKALSEIADLTFFEVGGVKKAWASVAGRLPKLNPELMKKALNSAR